MLNSLITFIQPITVGAFILIGVALLLQCQWQYGCVNMALGIANLFIFYGSKIFH
jgi:lipopolysaccharide export LptBFGC system permease protein LptF